MTGPDGGRTAVARRSTGGWVDALRVVGPIWLLATTLRYAAATVTEYFFRPEHGRLAQGALGVLLLPGDFDSNYFKDIATSGYFDPARNRPEFPAFFPGYPLAMRAVAAGTSFGITNTRLLIAGAMISAVASLVAAALLYRLVAESPLLRPSDDVRRASRLACLFLLFWPTATFLSAAYSESMFLALALGSWWNALRGRWWWAGLLCAGASLTRVNGVFVMVALLVLLLVRVAHGRERFTVGKLAAVLLGASGAAAYLGYLWWQTGDPMAWSTAQRIGWARDTVWPWTAFTNTLGGIREATDPLRAAQWCIDIGAVVLLLVVLGYLLRHRVWPEATLTFLTVAVLATSSNYLSIMRNTLTVFPVLIVIGIVLSRRGGVPVGVLLSISALWMVGTTATFTLTQWSG